MGYEVLLVLPLIYFILKSIIKGMKKIKWKVFFSVLMVLSYVFYFLVYPAPVGFCGRKPFWRGVRSMEQVDAALNGAVSDALRKMGFEKYNGNY